MDESDLGEGALAQGAEPIRCEIVRRVASAGAVGVGVDAYMDLCLRGDGVGYYRRQTALGRGGDFVTAPEISQVFGELIGIWCVLAWRWMGEPDAIRLVEIGPGRGTMMRDILRALKVAPKLRQQLRVELLEVSEALEATQRAILANSDVAITWSTPPASRFEGATILVANELLDALAIHQAVWVEGAWHPRIVVAGADGRLGFGHAADAIAPPPLVGASANHSGREQPAEGTITEWRMLGASGAEPDSSLVGMLSQMAEGGPFAGLLVDYGYDGPAPLGDTLQAVRDHRHVDPLEDPGLADLSALVDFADLRRQLGQAGLSATASLTQGEFLTALGIGARAARLVAAASDAGAVNRIESGVHRLLAPNGMGTRFRAIAVHNGQTSPPPFPA
ncbi:MAG: class I SAM-dependent methyltransferase [Rhizobiales bacterium]|nr:class I SAM-dependent methyltransferase [Hyphomicrobiales bacterium]